MSSSCRNSTIVHLVPPSEREASYHHRSPRVPAPELRRTVCAPSLPRTTDAGVAASGFAVTGSSRGGARFEAARVGGARSGEQGSASGRWPEMAGGLVMGKLPITDQVLLITHIRNGMKQRPYTGHVKWLFL
jgi:hypothetical protein